MSRSRSNSPKRQQKEVKDDAENDLLQDLLHSIGSFQAVALPVTITMLLASFAAVNIEDLATADALADTYLVYKPNDNDSSETQFEQAMVNAFAIVGVVALMTFMVVFCYKYNCSNLLLRYLQFSSAVLLGFLGGHLILVGLAQVNATIDVLSMAFMMYNFAVVGVIAIFYQLGVPTTVTQTYLVIISVITAWQVCKFPEWTTWALVVVLAFYDLCAVLTPCGPLKCLVNLIQSEGRPLPGLLYEAEVNRIHDDINDRSVTYYQRGRFPEEENNKRSHLQTTTHAASGSKSSSKDTVSEVVDLESPSNNIDAVNGAEILAMQSEPLLGAVGKAAETSTKPIAVKKNKISSRERRRESLTRFYTQYNPTMIPKIDSVLDAYQDNPDHVLWDDLAERYLEAEDSTIKLGLGDFVFYSVLVSRAAMYDFSTMIGSLLSILMGLGGTLFLLGIHKKALPALPISIFLGVTSYFLIRGILMDWVITLTNHSIII